MIIGPRWNQKGGTGRRVQPRNLAGRHGRKAGPRLSNATKPRKRPESHCVRAKSQYGVRHVSPSTPSQGISMADLPRLNQVIKASRQGQAVFPPFSPAEIEAAIALGQSKFDGVVYEMEHNFWDARALRDALQFMLNRRQLVQGGSLAPAVTPKVRIPPTRGATHHCLP